MGTGRSTTVGPASRPVFIPDDFLSRDRKVQHSGMVELPLHIWWSEPARQFDLEDDGDLARLIGLVLAEGTEDDVRQLVDADALLRLWPKLLLPTYVQKAWEQALRDWGVLT